jgi:hypothetical protein
MIYNVLLISEQKLKENAPIDQNVDSSELRYGIQQAQSIFLQESLGTNFYEKILEQVQNGDINLPANVKNKELLNNFIQPMLIAYSYYIVLDNMFIKIVNVGLQQFRSEQSNPVGIKEFTYLKNQAKDRAQFLDNLLRRHLVFQNADYPDYTLTTNNGQLIPEFAGAFKTSITLPSRRILNGGLNQYGYGASTLYDCPYPWWYGGPGSGE